MSSRESGTAWLQGHLEAFVTRIEQDALYGGQVASATGSKWRVLSLICIARSHESVPSKERSIHVAKLLRAHGGCLGVRSL